MSHGKIGRQISAVDDAVKAALRRIKELEDELQLLLRAPRRRQSSIDKKIAEIADHKARLYAVLQSALFDLTLPREAPAPSKKRL